MTARRPFPVATAALFAATVAACLVELGAGGVDFCQRWGFTPSHPTLATAFASMWLHDPDHLPHLAGNILALAVAGSIVEPTVGHGRFFAFFVAAGLGGAAMHWLVSPTSGDALVGMSGSISGLMALGAVLRPRVLFPFTMTYIAMNILGLYVTTPLVPQGVSAACHVGGFCAASGLVMMVRASGTLEAWRAAVA